MKHMQYLVDGHNVIGQSRRIRLDQPDDEAQLVAALHRWVLKHRQHEITVIFDGGVYGHPAALDQPGVRTIFAHSPQDADTRLITMIKRVVEPRRYRVVTSDRQIVAAARARGIEVIGSAEFAATLEQPPTRSTRSGSRRVRAEPKLGRAEVKQWLAEFGVTEDESQDQS